MSRVLFFFITILLLFSQTITAIELERVLTITSSAGIGGNILPRGETNVLLGRNQTFLINPEDGYDIAYLIVDAKITKPSSTYTFKEVTENHIIEAVFRPKKKYTINVVFGDNGHVLPSETLVVYEYDSQTFKIIPDNGYSVGKMIIDGSEIHPEPEFTFWDITDNHTISVVFAPLRQFTILAESGDGGNIIPSGKITAVEHSEQVFRIESQKGYMIKEVRVDLKSIGPINQFVFRDIKDNHSILATFMEERIVRGRTIDADTREGIRGCMVEAWAFRDKFHLATTQSDAQGKYTLTNIPPIHDLVLRCLPPSDMPLEIKTDTTGEKIPDNVTDHTDPGETIPDKRGDIINGEDNINGEEGTDPTETITEKIDIRQSKYPQQYYQNKSEIDKADVLSVVDQNLDNINFALKPYDNIGFRGRVHDGNNGVKNVMVTAFSAKTNFIKFAMTDENGNYTINYMVPSSDYLIAANFPELRMIMFYALSRGQTIGIDTPSSSALIPNFATMITPSSPYLNNIDLIFDPGSEISGHVYNSRGKPIENIRVNAWSQAKQRGNSSVTDKTGLYTIKGLTEVLPLGSKINGYLVEVRPNNYPYQAFNQASDPAEAILIATGRTDVDFYLRDGFSITGQVRPSSGKPLQDVHVIAHSKELNISRETLTNESGFYTFAGLTPSDDYRVVVFAPNYPVQFYNQQASPLLATPIDLLSQNAENINFILERGAVIQGSVQFEGLMGHPPQVTIHIWSFATESGGQVKVEQDGSFMMTGLNEKVSDYMIMANATDYPVAYYCDNGDDNPENDTVYERNLAKGVAPSEKEHILILSSGYTISGKISCEKMLMPSIIVKAWSEQSKIGKHTIATIKDNNFQYVFKGLASGTYEIFVDNPKFTSEKQIITIIDKDISDVNFSLKEIQGYEISGIIYNLPMNETISIHAWSLLLGEGKSIRIKGMGKAIQYHIKGLTPSSDYRLELISDRYPTQIYDQQTNMKNATLIDISTHDVRDIDFTIDQTTDDTVIVGTITFPQSAETGESVRINAHSISKRMSTSTEITLGSLNPVPYTLMGLISTDDIVLSIWPEHYPHQFYDQQTRGELATLIDTSDDTPDVINFILVSGRSISGTTIDSEGLTIVNVRVAVFSESTGSRGFAVSDTDGFFEIKGLKSADDYILMAQTQSMGRFFYVSNSSSVRNRSEAVSIDLSEQSAENLTVNLSEGYTVSGMVQSASGLLLENIRVVAWSDTLNSGNSTFTDENGEFIIQGLPSGMDYEVTARADKNLSYQSQTKTYIETGTSDIQFILSSLETYTLSGNVTDSSFSPVACVTINVCSRDDLNDCAWDQADDNGQYEISGLSAGTNYQLDVIPDTECSMGFVRIYPLAIVSNTTKDITLTAGASLAGMVLSESDSTPISNAVVQVISESTGFFHKTTTGVDGSYEVDNAPDVTDFEITASADGYIDATLSDQTGTSDLDLTLEAGGIISGQITDASSGATIEGAVVEIYSTANQNTLNYGGIAVTDDSGNYSVEQLKVTDESGDTIGDYKVTARATGYPEQSLSGNMAGDTVNVYLYAESTQAITISISDNSGRLTDTSSVILTVFNDDGYYAKKSVDSLSNYSLTGISDTDNYQLLFTAYTNEKEIIRQWASESGNGVESKDQAGTFMTGNTLNFVFEPDLKRSSKTYHLSAPGVVKNLRSTTHDYRTIYKRLRAIESSASSTVSNNPNVTVTWDAPEDEDDLDGYYTDFNSDDDYVYTSYNTVEKPVVRTRKITSRNLEGDDVSYYFHVAAVDADGRVGETTSIAFRIDTVAPTNVSVDAPSVVTDRNIALTLGATGASNVYISNVNFEESGDWDSLSTEKEWKLTRGDGIKSIYVRFRDAAGNSSDTMTVTTYAALVENSSPMISDRTFTLSDNLYDGLYVGIIEASDADDDPLTYTFNNSDNVFGFGLGADTGLLFVDQASLFPVTPGTYDLTVTVQDAEESASAQVRVNVSSGNYPPEMNNQEFSIDEHSPVNTPVGMVDAIDTDGDTILFSIISGNDPEIFSIDSGTGIISVLSNTLLDYEAQTNVILTIGACDSQITSTALVTISINNINDHAPVIQSQQFSIDENTSNHSIIGQLSVSDADGQTPVCAIESGNTDNAFAVDSLSCLLTVNDSTVLDHEKSPNHYILSISAFDGSLSGFSEITITINNINDLAPEILQQDCTIIENSPIDTKVYTLVALDPDQLTTMTFQFMNPDESLPFILDSENGIIRVSSTVDYETQTSYSLTVQVFDGNYTATAILTIDIINTNDNAPIINDVGFSINETIENEWIIGQLTASDVDGDSLEYRLLNYPQYFEITPDHQLKVLDNQLINSMEQGGFLMLTVSVDDGIYSDQANITLSITPVNDHAPLMENTSCSVSENASIGQIIIRMTATDEDMDTLTYSIIDGNHAQYFSINEQNGQISIAPVAQLDYESQDQYTLTVRAWDGHYETISLALISIINMNDNPPVTNDLLCTINENSPQNTRVCTVSAKDRDGDNLIYSFVDEVSAFLIEPSTGNILIQDEQQIDYETIQAYTIQTSITDGSYTVFQQTVIELINENDNPPNIQAQPIQTLEDNSIQTCIEWSDADMDHLTLIVQNPPQYGVIQQTGDICLTYTPNDNYFGRDILTIAAYDGFYFSTSEALTITIMPVNDPPVIPLIEDCFILEDSPSEKISITVSDIDNDLSELHLSVVSSQNTLIPNDNEHIIIEKTETAFFLQLIPSINQSGSSQISVTVFDGNAQVTTTFICTVNEENDPPEIMLTPTIIIIDEDSSSSAISIEISDNETLSEQLSLGVRSNNPQLIPNTPSSLNMNYTGSAYQLTIIPLSNKYGFATVDVTVNDGSQSTTQSLSVTVNPINDPPEIMPITDLSTDEDISPGSVALTITDQETAIELMDITIVTNNQTVLPPQAITIFYNTSSNQYELAIHPKENQWGDSLITIIVSDGELVDSTQFMVTIMPVNDPPEISDFTDQTVPENTVIGPLPFTAIDIDNNNLSITVKSSNTDLIPMDNDHILISNQSLTLTPVDYASGNTFITITVDDGELQCHSVFEVTVLSVNQAPVISEVQNQNFDEDTPMPELMFTIWDAETPAEQLNVWAETNNSSLFPDTPEHIQVKFKDSTYSLLLIPNNHQNGAATVIIYADDGITVSQQIFDVWVNPIEDMPVLIPPMDIQINEDALTQKVHFQVSDPETSASDLIITAMSDNLALLPQESIEITGTTDDRWLIISIAPGHFGLAHVQLTLSDTAGNTQTHIQEITVLRGNTLSFNGENDYVEVPDHDTLHVKNILSVEAWIMPCTITTADQRIINKINDQGHGLSLALISNNYIQVIAGNDSQAITLTSITPVEPNQWTHIAVSMTSQGMKLYINGKNDIETNQPVSVDMNQGLNLIFGGKSDNPTASSYCGLLDDIRLWQSERTEDDIHQYMYQRLEGNEPSLLGYWHFKNSDANDYCTLNDNPNNGIIHKDAPMISVISNKTTHEDTPFDIIEFTVNDLQTSPENLTVTVQSSDHVLIPESNMILSGTSQTRYLQINPAKNQHGTAIITVFVDDNETITTRTFNVKVLAVNDSPLISIQSQLSLLEDQTSPAIAFQITDIDNGLNSLNISIQSSNVQILPQKNITVNQAEQWIALTPTMNQSGNVQLTVTVSDGLLSHSSIMAVTIVPVNDHPELSVIQNREIPEDSPEIIIPFTIQDIETSSDQLSVSLEMSPPDGIPFSTIYLTGENSDRYLHAVPIPNASGVLMLTLTVTDDDSVPASFSQGFTLAILPINDPPVMSIVYDQMMNEDSFIMDILIDIMDIETTDQELQLSAVSLNTILIPQENIELTESEGNQRLSFAPATHAFGEGNIQLILTDSDGASVRQTFKITVNPVNDPPYIHTIETLSILEDTVSDPISITVSDIETPIENLTISIQSKNTSLIDKNGLVLTNENDELSLRITPIPDQYGTGIIELVVADSEGLTQTTLIYLSVLGVNDPPIISALSNITLIEDSMSDTIKLSMNDCETPVNQLMVQWNITQTNGLAKEDIQINYDSLNQSFTILPQSNVNGQATICFTIQDSEQLTSSTCFIVEIQPVNDLPTLSSIQDISIDEDRSISPITINISDVETEADKLNIQWNVLNCSVINTISIQGTGKERTLNISIFENTWGSCAINLTVTDNDGGRVSTEFMLNVSSVNDPPVIETIHDIMVDEDQSIPPVKLNVFDVETDVENLRIVMKCHSELLPYSFTTQYNENLNIHELIFTITPDAFGASYIDIQVIDPQGLTDSTRFNIDVLPVNDPPVMGSISNQVVDEDCLLIEVPVKIQDLETSLDNMNIQVSDPNQTLLNYNGFSITDRTSINLKFTPVSNAFGQETITVMASDNEGLTAVQTFDILVKAVNDPPQISPISNKISKEDYILGPFPIYVSDIDNSIDVINVAFIFADKTFKGYSTITPSELTLIPPKDLYGSTEVFVVASDPQGLSSIESFTWSIQPQNDPPTISVVDSIVMDEDSSQDIAFDLDHVDFSKDDLSVELSSNLHTLIDPEKQIINESLVKITPEPDQWGTTELCLTATDPNLLTAQACFSITIAAINDSPVISVIKAYTMTEDNRLSIPFSVEDIDSSITTSMISTSCNVSIDISEPVMIDDYYEISIAPPINFSGLAIVSISVSDTHGGKSYENVRVAILGENDPPIAYPGELQVFEDLSVTGQLLGTDIDGDELTYSIGQLPQYGTVQLLEENNVQYKPFQDVYGTDKFSFYVSDFTTSSAPAWITVVIQGTPDAPTANAGNDLTINELQTVVLDAYQTTDPDRDIVSYQWQQISGVSVSLFNADEMEMSFVCPDVSNDQDVIIELLVTDATHRTSKDTVTIHVIDISPPSPGFHGNPVEGIVPHEVQFTDTSIGKITSWFWEFGDGYISREANPLHIYSTSGEYTVILTVTGPYGTKSKERTDYINASAAELKANFIASPTTGVAPLSVKFTDHSQGEVDHMVWDFGDGSQNSQPSPIHTFEMPGQYTVSLTIYDSDLMDIKVKPAFISVSDRTISGKIAEENNPDNGIRGYWVIAYIGDESFQTQSDMDGNYAISGLPASDVIKLGVWPPAGDDQFLTQIYQQKDSLSEADLLSTQNGNLSQVNIYLKPMPLLHITGQVHDGNQGKDSILVSAFSDDIQWGAVAMTDSTGHYTLVGLKPANDYRVSVFWDQQNKLVYYALPETGTVGVDIPTSSQFQEQLATPIEIDAENLSNIDIILSFQNTCISGQIVDNNGHGIKNTWVNAWSERLENGNGTLSDENGYYTIIGLTSVSQDDVLEKGYQVSLQLNGLHIYPDLISVPSENINIQVSMTTGLSGNISSEIGLPVTDACISLWSQSDSGKIYTGCTSGNGDYAINDLPYQSDYLLMVTSADYPEHYYPNTTTLENATIIDLSNGPMESIDMVLRNGGLISGQVYVESIDQKAPSGIWVNVWSSTSGINRQVQTDEYGIFQFNGLDESVSDYHILIQDSDYLPAFYNRSSSTNTSTQKDQATTVPANSQSISMVLTKGLSVCGYITGNVDESEDFRLTVKAENFGIYQTIDIASEITPVFCVDHLSQDYYTFMLYQGQQVLFTQSMLVISNMNQLELSVNDMTLGSISGEIQGLSENIRAQIRVWSDTLQLEKTLRIIGTGDDFSYKVDNLPLSDDYSAVLSMDGYPDLYYDQTPYLSFAKTIDISTNHSTTINFTIQERTASLLGTIHFSEEHYTGKIHLMLWSSSLGTSRQKTISIIEQQDIPYSMSHLERASDYILSIKAEGFESLYYANVSKSVLAQQIHLENGETITGIDFYLTKGITISGNIETDLLFSQLTVEAENQVSGEIVTSKIADGGSYKLSGLVQFQSYRLWVRHDNGTKWFYAADKPVMTKSLAEMITPESSISYDMTIDSLKPISGMIKSTSGMPVSNVWVLARDTVGNLSIGRYSKDDGSYEIPFLPDQSYKVMAIPNPNSIYVPSEKTGIQAGNSSVNFILEKNSGATLSGTVRNLKTTGEPMARIEVIDDQSTVIQTVTNRNGKYNIYGLNTDLRYYISVFPSSESDAAFWQTSVIINESDQTLDMELPNGNSMTGLVTDKLNQQAVASADVIIQSESTGYYVTLKTDEKGKFECFSMPNSSDFKIHIVSKEFIPIHLSNQRPVNYKHFQLTPSGILTGKVIDQQTGKGIAKAVLYIQSTQRNIERSSQTDTKGHFSITGLIENDEQGQAITDYVLTVIANQYPVKTIRNIQPGQEREIALSQLTSNRIQLKINDASMTNWIIDIFESDHNFVQSYIIQPDVWVECSGLETEKTYQVRISNESMTEIYWIAENGTLVDIRENAFQYTPSSQINIDITQPEKRTLRSLISKAEIISLPEISSSTHTIFTSMSPAISAIPVIDINWTISSSETIIGYYVIFNEQSDFEWSKTTSSGFHMIPLDNLSSPEFSGNEQSIYCHVAAVNEMGNIGPTAHSGPYVIDTIAPENISIMAPSSSNTRSIQIQLFAQGSQEMYISTLGYEIGSTWQPYEQMIGYLLPSDTGQHILYTSFRDRAKNTSRTSTSVVLGNPENQQPVANAQTFTMIEDKIFSGTLTGQDNDNDSIQFSIQTFPVQGTLTLIDQNTGEFTYIPETNFFGNDYFTFSVNDGAVNSQVSQCTMLVINDNDPPVLQSSEIQVQKNVSYTGQLLATDPDQDTLTYLIYDGPSKGKVNIIDAQTGQFQYIPENDMIGKDSFLFTAKDNEFQSQPVLISIDIIESQSTDHWYSGIYPEGYIVDKNDIPIENVIITYYAVPEIAYTRLTDSNGYFVFDTPKKPNSNYPLTAMKDNLSTIWMAWPHDNAPQVFVMLSVLDSETVMFTGTCKGADTNIDALIMADGMTVKSTAGQYTLAVQQSHLPVDLEVIADGYDKKVYSGIHSGVDIVLEKTEIKTEQSTDKEDSGCFIDILGY